MRTRRHSAVGTVSPAVRRHDLCLLVSLCIHPLKPKLASTVLFRFLSDSGFGAQAMAPKDKERLDGPGKGRGRGRGKGGRGAPVGVASDTAKRLQELDGGSVEAESNFEILRAQRAQARKGVKQFKDIRENEGVDEDDPLNSIDDGIRLEPFNMRREMREGHFDESGFYVLNKDEEKKVTDAWLDTVDQAERTATFRAADKQNKALDTAANRLSAMAKNLGPDSEGEEEALCSVEWCKLMIWGKGYNETRFAGLTDFCMQFAQRLSQSRRLCSERDSLGSCEHMRTEADSFYTKCMRQQCHEVTGAGCAITAMSFFWEGHGDHLTQLSQLCRTQTLAQPSKRHILLGPCKISMQPFCKGTRIKGVFRLQIERLSEDIFERVTSFLEPRRPQHPAHAGWLCWQRVAAWYTSKGCMDVVHVVISGKCLLKIWLSDPEAFETAQRMAMVLPLL
eukprot:s4586_g2.t2